MHVIYSLISDKWILANTHTHTIHKIQSREFKRLNKLKCLSEDTSVPLGREKKV